MREIYESTYTGALAFPNLLQSIAESTKQPAIALNGGGAGTGRERRTQ